MLITFEGIEGCGKTTQITLFGEYLNGRKLPFLTTREPGGTPIGNKIREILLDSRNSSIVPLAELFLYAASRSQHIHEIIKPALIDGKIVLCDRFTDATIAYQGFARGIDCEFIKELNRLATGQIVPDLSFLIDCPPETGLSRAASRINLHPEKKREDRFEKEDISFHEKVREGYLRIARMEPQRVVILKGTGDINSIHREICRIASEKITAMI